LPLEYKEILLILSWQIHQVFNHSIWTKNEENMRLQLQLERNRGDPIFSEKLKQTSISHPPPVFFKVTPLLLMLKEHFVALQFEHPMIQKLPNLVEKMSKILESV